MPVPPSPTAPFSGMSPVGGLPGLHAPRGTYQQPTIPDLKRKPANPNLPAPPMPGAPKNIGATVQRIGVPQGVPPVTNPQLRTASDKHLDKMVDILSSIAVNPIPIPDSIKRVLNHDY